MAPAVPWFTYADQKHWRHVIAELGGDYRHSEAGEMEQRRKVLDDVLAANPDIELSAKVASDNSKILRNDSAAVAQAVRELAVAHGPHDWLSRQRQARSSRQP